MEVARYVRSTYNRNLVIFLQDITKRVLQLLVFYCDAKHSGILFICNLSYIQLINFFTQPDCRNFLPEHCNTIIKLDLCGEELPSLLPLLQGEVFQGKQGILQQINICPSNASQKKACIKPCYTNNSNQSLTRM